MATALGLYQFFVAVLAILLPIIIIYSYVNANVDQLAFLTFRVKKKPLKTLKKRELKLYFSFN